MNRADDFLEHSEWFDLNNPIPVRPSTTASFYRNKKSNVEDPLIYTTLKLENVRWYKQLKHGKQRSSLPYLGKIKKARPPTPPTPPPRKPPVPFLSSRKKLPALSKVEENIEKEKDEKNVIPSPPPKNKLKKRKKKKEIEEEDDDNWFDFLNEENESAQFKKLLAEAKEKKSKLPDKKVLVDEDETLDIETILHNLKVEEDKSNNIVREPVLPKPKPEPDTPEDKPMEGREPDAVTPLDETISVNSSIASLSVGSSYDKFENFAMRSSLRSSGGNVNLDIDDPLERSRALLSLLSKATDNMKGDMKGIQQQEHVKAAMNVVTTQMRVLEKFKKEHKFS
jgi:hypothetical protein